MKDVPNYISLIEHDGITIDYGHGVVSTTKFQRTRLKYANSVMCDR